MTPRRISRTLYRAAGSACVAGLFAPAAWWRWIWCAALAAGANALVVWLLAAGAGRLDCELR